MEILPRSRAKVTPISKSGLTIISWYNCHNASMLLEKMRSGIDHGALLNILLALDSFLMQSSFFLEPLSLLPFEHLLNTGF
jgi:hypothetical protein